jgi:Domain of unknown function (DUF397)
MYAVRSFVLPSSEIESRQLSWRKSRRSMNNGDCVEVAPANGKILVRDSKNPAGPALAYPATVWREFVIQARPESLG